MKIDVLSLFPEMFEGVFGSSILKKAAEKQAVSYKVTNFRDYADNKHSTVDDYPYGGGAGMVLKAQPIFDAVEALKGQAELTPRVVLLCPQGERYTQKKAEELAEEDLTRIKERYASLAEAARARSDLHGFSGSPSA